MLLAVLVALVLLLFVTQHQMLLAKLLLVEL
jgi:hypothetical protein